MKRRNFSFFFFFLEGHSNFHEFRRELFYLYLLEEVISYFTIKRTRLHYQESAGVEKRGKHTAVNNGQLWPSAHPSCGITLRTLKQETVEQIHFKVQRLSQKTIVKYQLNHIP